MKKAGRIVIGGEMLELGSEEHELHREAGREIAGTGIIFMGVRVWPEKILAAPMKWFWLNKIF